MDFGIVRCLLLSQLGITYTFLKVINKQGYVTEISYSSESPNYLLYDPFLKKFANLGFKSSITQLLKFVHDFLK